MLTYGSSKKRRTSNGLNSRGRGSARASLVCMQETIEPHGCLTSLLSVSDTLAIPPFTVCSLKHIILQLEKDNSRMKVGSRMFRKGLETEVFKLESGGLLTNTTSEQFGYDPCNRKALLNPPMSHVPA